MGTKIRMLCDVKNDEDFSFLVTPHKDGSLSIHGIDLDVAIRCTTKQAIGLCEELTKAINKSQIKAKAA